MKESFILVATILFLSACGEKDQQPVAIPKFTLSDTMQHMIEVDTVRMDNISNEIALSGEVNFNENAVVKVFPRGSGQVLQSTVSLGDYVHRGQALAVIRSADVAGSYSDLTGASADLAIAKRQMDNAQSLYKAGMSSEREYTEAKQAYEKAAAARGKVQSMISINGGGSSNASGRYVITAPIDGYVVEKKVAAGSFLRADAADNLFTISDLKNVWVSANVYEADIPKVKEGYEVKVKVAPYPDKEFNGRIEKISQVLDPQSKAMRVRITLANPEMLLKPDMFAKVIVSNKESASAISIPTKALIAQDGKNYVVTYRSKSDLDIAEVNILKTIGEHTYLSGGVQPGQMVVTKEQLLIFNQLAEE